MTSLNAVAGLHSSIVYPSFIQQTCLYPLSSEGVFVFLFLIFILVNLPSPELLGLVNLFLLKVPPPLLFLELNKRIWLCPDCVSSVYVCISS